MDFGKFKIVSIALLALMNTFKSWLGNYGLAIILLTCMVKGTSSSRCKTRPTNR